MKLHKHCTIIIAMLLMASTAYANDVQAVFDALKNTPEAPPRTDNRKVPIDTTKFRNIIGREIGQIYGGQHTVSCRYSPIGSEEEKTVNIPIHISGDGKISLNGKQYVNPPTKGRLLWTVDNNDHSLNAAEAIISGSGQEFTMLLFDNTVLAVCDGLNKPNPLPRLNGLLQQLFNGNGYGMVCGPSLFQLQAKLPASISYSEGVFNIDGIKVPYQRVRDFSMIVNYQEASVSDYKRIIINLGGDDQLQIDFDGHEVPVGAFVSITQNGQNIHKVCIAKK